MLKIEYLGEQYGCPYCHRQLVRSGLCGCGASIKLMNMTERAAVDSENLTRERADFVMKKVSEVTTRVSKFAPFKKGTARVSFFVSTEGIFYGVIAKKQSTND